MSSFAEILVEIARAGDERRSREEEDRRYGVLIEEVPRDATIMESAARARRTIADLTPQQGPEIRLPLNSPVAHAMLETVRSDYTVVAQYRGQLIAAAQSWMRAQGDRRNVMELWAVIDSQLRAVEIEDTRWLIQNATRLAGGTFGVDPYAELPSTADRLEGRLRDFVEPSPSRPPSRPTISPDAIRRRLQGVLLLVCPLSDLANLRRLAPLSRPAKADKAPKHELDAALWDLTRDPGDLAGAKPHLAAILECEVTSVDRAIRRHAKRQRPLTRP